MSVNIATMGLFNSPDGGGEIINAAGGVIYVPEEKSKPIIKVTKITSKDEGSKKKIEVISISGE